MKKILMMLIGMICVVHAVSIDDTLSPVILSNENAGTSDSKIWNSVSLQGKFHVLLYMDPDKREESQVLLDRLNALDIDSSKYSTVAIVNLAATWMPDTILESLLAKKQKDLKNTSFIFDKQKYLVRKWQMKDDASNVLILDKDSKIMYQQAGKISDKYVDEIIKILLDMLK